MKILYIALGGKGGSDKALVDLLSKLVKYDIDPLVVCGRPDLTVELEKIGVKSLVYDFTWAINPPIHSIRDKILYLPRQIKCFLKRKVDVVNLEKAVKDFSPDLISTNVGVVNLGYNLGKKMGLPHVWHIREYQDQDHGMHPVNGMNYFRRLLRKNQFNIAITKDLYQYFRMCSPAVQIYDGVRDCRSHFASCVPQKYFIFAGFLFQGKGLEELLHAYKSYRERGGGHDLYILGAWNESNPFHRWVKQYIDDNGLKGAKILGFRNDVDELMVHSSAVIVSSKFEGFGRVACEGMFNKTVVIGKNTSGTREQFDNLDEYVGKKISLRCQTEVELVERMFEVENLSSELRFEIVEKSFEVVNSLYSNETSASQVYEYYKTVLKLYSRK